MMASGVLRQSMIVEPRISSVAYLLLMIWRSAPSPMARALPRPLKGCRKALPSILLRLCKRAGCWRRSTIPNSAHLILAGTGLTHLGSAEGRDKMHKAAAATEKPTDSMRMFLMGVEGGKPKPGQVGAQPEWFYKGDGSSVIAPERPLTSPSFALDGGEEPEIAAIYIIGPDGTPFRLGFSLGNEFSDHVTERGNYLWLAHSKLRQASIGPELLVGPLPGHVEGSSRIRRDGTVIWEKPFLSGEDNMSHTIANLEHHHFKYDLFRRPGDVHVHFFGTATLSFSDGIKPQDGDVFEVEAKPFSLPLRNRLATDKASPFSVKAL